MYPPRVIAQFQNERCVGDLPDAHVRVQIENPACGDVLRLAVQHDGERFTAVRFRARGCVASIACAVELCDMLTDAKFSDASLITREKLNKSLGGLPPASQHATALAIDALRAVLAEIAESLANKRKRAAAAARS